MFGELYILVNITLELEAPPHPPHHLLSEPEFSSERPEEGRGLTQQAYHWWCVFTHDLAYR